MLPGSDLHCSCHCLQDCKHNQAQSHQEMTFLLCHQKRVFFWLVLLSHKVVRIVLSIGGFMQSEKLAQTPSD